MLSIKATVYYREEDTPQTIAEQAVGFQNKLNVNVTLKDENGKTIIDIWPDSSVEYVREHLEKHIRLNLAISDYQEDGVKQPEVIQLKGLETEIKNRLGDPIESDPAETISLSTVGENKQGIPNCAIYEIKTRTPA